MTRHRFAAARVAAWVGLLALVGPAARAQTDAPTLQGCAEIGSSSDRLVCYDKLAGRAVVPPVAAASAPGVPPTTSQLAASDTAVAQAPPAASGSSLTSKFWELDPGDKRGTFNFTGYRANYVLPMHVTNRINRSPDSPTQPAVTTPDYRRIEGKIQLSLRTKVVQGLLLPDADLWAAYTQQSLWQVYNGTDSKPFRNTDYEPELIYVVPTPEALRRLPFGWQWRYAQLGVAHQSNGQSDPLSRSWNRVYLGAGFERGDIALTAKVLTRLKESLDDDNNPDLTAYRGRAEFQLSWTPGAATASLGYRNSFRDARRGALQAEFTYPVYRDQPNGIRWYLQAFTGYGETLTDYNFRQTSVGAGLTFLQF